MLDLSRLSCLGEALRDAVLTYKTNTALIEADRHREKARFTYSELRREAERFAGSLQAHGFAPGDRCAILLSNQSKWLIGALGALWSGAVLVPLDYKLTAPEQLALLSHARPQVLFVEYASLRLLLKENVSVLERTRIIVTEAPERADIGPALRYEDLPAAKFELSHRERDDVACIVYSSGTSGTPKGCMLTHGNYLAQAQVLGRMYPMGEDERFFSILPTNHAIDFMLGFVLPLLFGGGIVHQRTLRPEFLMPTMDTYGITHIALVPRMLRALQTKIEEQLDEREPWQRTLVERLASVNETLTQRAPNHRLSSTLLAPIHKKFGGKLRLIVVGGAFVERANAEWFNRMGLPVVIAYGLTEACTALTVNDLSPFRSDTVGPPVQSTELQLRDQNEEGIGEVWVRGPTVMKGYLDAPELTREAIVDGWLRTGDLGTLDAAGHLKLVGRAKNMIVTAGGKNVYPEDVESAFARLDGAEELAVFAENYIWPSKTLVDEQLILVLRSKPGEDPQALLEQVRALNLGLSEYKRVSAVALWNDEFPRTASQKIKRELLARELGARAPRASILKVTGP
ncbi:MAG: Long-chain-fatty-acid--CoA ligase [Myxococcaceae bacterium]|nr:Long-chain-fatty-acid--CoA ligase [Myxococcaceae bacterium]